MEPVVAADERADDCSPFREATLEQKATPERRRLEARGQIGLAFSTDAGEELVQIVKNADGVHPAASASRTAFIPAAPATRTAFIPRRPRAERRSSGGSREPTVSRRGGSRENVTDGEKERGFPGFA